MAQSVTSPLPSELLSLAKHSLQSTPVHASPSNDSGAGTARHQSLDIYAHKYVPLWLRGVNDSFAIPKYALPLRRIDYQLYISLFSGSLFLEPLSDIQLAPLAMIDISVSNLIPEKYTSFWQERLQIEYASQASQYQWFSLFNVTLEAFDNTRLLFRLKIPGIRENAPRVDLGDVLLVRPLSPVLPSTISTEAQRWYQNGEGIAPGFVGIEHHAVVWSVSRRDEFVILRMAEAYNHSRPVNVTIPVQQHKCSPTWRAVLEVGDVISRDCMSPNRWLASMLFPSETDCVFQTTLSRGTFDLKWNDAELNHEQKRAVHSVVTKIYGTVPYLVSGPPGTGKTKTIVEIALQILDSAKENAHLLICAPSDSAADTLVIRLAKQLKPKQLFRLNGWTRSSSEVPGTVLPFCHVDDDNLFSLPKFETMMAYDVVVTTCRDAEMLVQARLTNTALSMLTSRLLTLVGGAQSARSSAPLHWTCLLLDEAAQATEPEVLIPLTVVMPPIIENADTILPQVVLAGDEHQLGPRLATRSANGHNKSLFQRLSEIELYAKHPLSRQNGLKPLKSAMLPMLRPPFTNLIRNYRSHPAILSVPSVLFYHDTLIPERTATSSFVRKWSGWPSLHGWPILFYQNDSLDDVESILDGDGTGAGSLVNREEATGALSMVESLLKSRMSMSDLNQEEIIVMSPFRAQVNHLRNTFRRQGLYNVNIGPLEAFQGLESRIVVLCTTRTRLGQIPQQERNKFVQEDIQRSLGVIGDRRRFNVAITRAKEALIVIGNASCLTCTDDPCWVSFLDFCRRNNLVSNPDAWPASSKEQLGRPLIGRLERALNYAAMVREANRQQRRTENSTFGSSQKAVDSNTNIDKQAHESRRLQQINLKGTFVDLDEQMWRLQELKMLEDSELIDADQDHDDNTTFEITEFAAATGYECEQGEKGKAPRALPSQNLHTLHQSSTKRHADLDANASSIATIAVSSSRRRDSSETKQPSSQQQQQQQQAASGSFAAALPRADSFRLMESRRAQRTHDFTSPPAAMEMYDRDLAEEFDRAGCETQ